MADYVIKRICSEAKSKPAATKSMWGKNPNYFKLHMLHSHLEIPIRFLEVPNKNRSSFCKAQTALSPLVNIKFANCVRGKTMRGKRIRKREHKF